MELDSSAHPSTEELNVTALDRIQMRENVYCMKRSSAFYQMRPHQTTKPASNIDVKGSHGHNCFQSQQNGAKIVKPPKRNRSLSKQ